MNFIFDDIKVIADGEKEKIASELSFFAITVLLPAYFVSLWRVCFLQNLQYLFISNLSGVFFLFFIVS